MQILNNNSKPLSFMVSGNSIIFLILFCFIVSAVTQFSIYINHDVGSHIILSQRLINKLEIVDPNPPLLFYLLIIPNIIANVTQISVLTVFRTIIYALIILSILQCYYILKRIPKLYNNKLIILTLVFIFTLMPGKDFGQREHILLLLVMPYIFSMVRRSFGEEVNNLQSIIIGIFAGIGFCLKPYFLLLPFFLEAYLFYKNRRLNLRKHMESIIIFIIFTIYIVSIFIFNRDYITRTVPYIIYVYGAYNDNIINLLFKLTPIIIVFIIYWLAKDNGRFALFGNLLLLTVICMAIIYLFQGKGWSYHLYPFNAASLLFIIFCCSIIHSSKKLIRLNIFKKTLYYFAIIFIIISVSNSVKWHYEIYEQYKSGKESLIEYNFIQFIEKQAIHFNNIYFLSTSVKPAFPVVNYSGVGWSSRFNTLWMLPAILNNKKRPVGLADETRSNKLSEIKSYLFESVLADLKAQPPSLIFVDNRRYKQGLGNQKFDFMEYFMKNPIFKEIMSQYKEITCINDYRVFKKINPK